MNYYDKIEQQAAEELAALLAKPLSQHEAPSSDEFDPWDIFPLYGSYSSSFDDMAIRTLENILNGNREYEGLANEMFREMLCKKGLCNYGTSPRVCFPSASFRQMLPEYIDKWKQYYKVAWNDDYSPEP